MKRSQSKKEETFTLNCVQWMTFSYNLPPLHKFKGEQSLEVVRIYSDGVRFRLSPILHRGKSNKHNNHWISIQQPKELPYSSRVALPLQVISPSGEDIGTFHLGDIVYMRIREEGNSIFWSFSSVKERIFIYWAPGDFDDWVVRQAGETI